MSVEELPELLLFFSNTFLQHIFEGQMMTFWNIVKKKKLQPCQQKKHKSL